MSHLTSTPDEMLVAVTAGQFGCFTARQAREVGFSDRAVRSRLSRGLWRPVHPGVYVAATTPVSRAVVATAARLRVGPAAIYSHFTAAGLLGVDIRHDDSRIWLRAPYSSGHRSWPGVKVTRSRHEVAPVLAHRQPTVPIARTLVDLAGHVGARALAGALYDVTRRHLVDVDSLRGEAEAVGGGLRGLKQLRAVLETFDPAYEAMVEAHFDRALSEAGVVLTPQVEVRDGPFLVARLDLADEELLMGIEVDGWRYHGGRDAQLKDRARDRALRALGWNISRFDAVTVLEQTDRAVREVVAVRQRLLFEGRGRVG